MHMTESLCCIVEINVVNQLHFNKIKFLKRKWEVSTAWLLEAKGSEHTDSERKLEMPSRMGSGFEFWLTTFQPSDLR